MSSVPKTPRRLALIAARKNSLQSKLRGRRGVSAKTLLHELKRHLVLPIPRSCDAVGGNIQIDIADMNLASCGQNAGIRC